MKLYGDKDNLNILQMLKWNKTKILQITFYNELYHSNGLDYRLSTIHLKTSKIKFATCSEILTNTLTLVNVHNQQRK